MLPTVLLEVKKQYNTSMVFVCHILSKFFSSVTKAIKINNPIPQFELWIRILGPKIGRIANPSIIIGDIHQINGHCLIP